MALGSLLEEPSCDLSGGFREEWGERGESYGVEHAPELKGSRIPLGNHDQSSLTPDSESEHALLGLPKRASGQKY